MFFIFILIAIMCIWWGWWYSTGRLFNHGDDDDRPEMRHGWMKEYNVRVENTRFPCAQMVNKFGPFISLHIKLQMQSSSKGRSEVDTNDNGSSWCTPWWEPDFNWAGDNGANGDCFMGQCSMLSVVHILFLFSYDSACQCMISRIH